MKKKSQLPRLSPEAYLGRAVVFWTYTIEDRKRGWLNDNFHREFREVLLHSACRYRFLVPADCLMPDHLQWIGMGVSDESDQRLATRYIRKCLSGALSPARWQRQPHDHVLREGERKRNAFASTCYYIWENPVRKGLAESSTDWSFSGCIVAGYADLDWRNSDYWKRFWRIYQHEVEGRGVLGKSVASAAQADDEGLA